MKRKLLIVLALMLVVTTVLALVACGGGDTTMHKIQSAADDGEITYDDIYTFATLQDYPKDADNNWLFEDYKHVEARLDNVNRNYVVFSANTIQISTTEGSFKNYNVDIAWNASDDTVTITIGDYWLEAWNPMTNQWMDVFNTAQNDTITLPMSAFYENGEFKVADITATEFTELTSSQLDVKFGEDAAEAKEMIVADLLSLTNDALKGLDGVYGNKGYPIKPVEAK